MKKRINTFVIRVFFTMKSPILVETDSHFDFSDTT